LNTLQRHEHFKKLVKNERNATHEVLLMIQSFDITKEYRALGYSSLFDYLTLGHGYSAGAAHRRISAARLMKEIPQIEESLKTGELSLTQVSLTQVAINQEQRVLGKAQKIQASKKLEAIKKIKSKNSFETKKVLKQVFPNFEIPKPQIQPAANNKVHATLEFTEENWEKIQKLMAHMSHKVPTQKLEDLLLYWVKALEKKEAKVTAATVVRAKAKSNSTSTVEVKNKNSSIAVMEVKSGATAAAAEVMTESKSTATAAVKTAASMSKNDTVRGQPRLGQNEKTAIKKSNQRYARSTYNNRIYFSVAINRQLQKQSQDQCEYISKLTGRRCESKLFLETDHRIPLARNGTNAPENLRKLCWAHNQQAAKEWGLLT
jgi:hypothetical protein